MAAEHTRKKSGEARGPGGRLRQVMDPVLAKALSHYLRSHVLATLGDRIASPKEIADELGIDSRDLSYHVNVLLGMGMIGLVRTEKRRGAREHFYELIPPVVYLDDREWMQMPVEIQSRISADLFQAVMDDAVEALQAGTFSAHSSHQSRTTMIVNEQGRRAVLKLMRETLERLAEVQEDCAEDLRTRPQEGIPMEVFMVGFETASGSKPNVAEVAVDT